MELGEIARCCKYRRGESMSEILTLQLPDDLARRARAFTVATNRPLEEVVLDPIASLSPNRSSNRLPMTRSWLSAARLWSRNSRKK